MVIRSVIMNEMIGLERMERVEGGGLNEMMTFI
jgi:hypothetical protein